MRSPKTRKISRFALPLILLTSVVSISAIGFSTSILEPLGLVSEGSFLSSYFELTVPAANIAAPVDAEPASVRTNKAHYSPGDTAKITGENFGANETVTLQVTHSDGTPPGGGGHDPWTATTDDNGFFITTWFVDPDDSLHSTFLLTAVSDSASASATFSDPGPSADLDQCRNGKFDDPNDCTGDGSGATGWVNGNVGEQQGHFIEGYSIPYRMRMADVTAGSWTLDIGYDTIHSSKHAIDFLTHYDLIGGTNVTPTVPSHNLPFGHTAECIDPSDFWIGGATNEDNCNTPPPQGATPDSTFNIPKPTIPNSVAGNPPGTPPCTTPYTGSDVLAGATSCPGTTFDSIAGAGQAYMTMWNGEITGIEYVQGQQNVVSGQGQQHTMMRIYFTVSAAQAAADDGNVDLAWGGHIGRSLDWGTGNAASGISGSPYHMNLHGLCAGSTENDGTLCTDGGAQDRSLAAGAVFQTGNVKIIKNIQNGTPDGTFGYTTTGSGLSNFNLTTVSGTAFQEFNGIAPGAKTVDESTIPNTHLFVSLNCVDPDGGTTTNGTTANIDLDGGETVTCTYTNRENPNVTQGRIVIIKDTIPNDTQSFTFTPSYPGVPPYTGGTFSLIDGGQDDSCGIGDNCLAPGNYQVVETPNSSYATTASCGGIGESFSAATGTLSGIPVTAGQTTTCTFTNRKPDAQIDLSPLNATNAVNDAHTITATVQQDDTYAAGAPGDAATGFGPAPDGTLVTFSLLNNTAGAAFVGGVNTCTTTGGTGTCTVQINTSTAGGVDIHATTTFSVLGVSLTRSTGTGGLNSADAHKTYVDAQIDVSPLTATNEVNSAHTITATVQQDDGIPAGAPGDAVTGFGPAPNGTLVTFSLLNNTAGAAFVGGVATCTTTGGSCSVQINTSTPGGVDIHATTTFSVGGVSLTRATGTGGLNSADAHKTYVDAQIDITPLEDTNPINEAHTFTATVQQDDGLDAPAGDNVTGWAPAPDGTTVVFSFVTNTIGATFVGNDNDCTTVNGSCTVQINSSSPGTVVVRATTTFSVGGQSLTRTTGTGGNNSTDATKIYVAGVIIVDKVTVPADDPQLFTFDPSWTADFDLADDTTPHNSGNLAPGPYSVSETVPDGWAQTSAVCTGDDDGNDPASIQLDAGETITCTFTNTKQPRLKLVKTVTNNNGGTAVANDWDLTATGSGGFTEGTPAAADATFRFVTIGVNYALSETGPSNYTAGTFSCDGGTQDGDNIQLAAGDSVTCTINNDDIPPQLHLRKIVTNNNGGTAVATDWTLTADGTGSNDLSGSTPVDSGSGLQADTWALGESGPAGYSSGGGYVCVGGTQVGQNITVGIGGSATCTITNNDIPPQLHLRKIVINDNGGTKTVADFTLNANGTGSNDLSGTDPVDSGAGLQADTWVLSETNVYGYTRSDWVCVGGSYNKDGGGVETVSVGIAGSATCTITNNDDPGTIIIRKITKPTGASTSFPFDAVGTGYNDFSLTDGQQNSQSLNAGSYSAQELVPLGWVLTGIGGSTDPNTPYACTVTGSGGSTGNGSLLTQTVLIDLKNGDTVTCVFENTGEGVTRTQGFWATHPQLAEIAWNGGTAFGHTFPGVPDKLLCGETLTIDAGVATGGDPKPAAGNSELMGGFWGSISRATTGAKRSNLDQSRMSLLQQLLAAELNFSAFGSVPAQGSIAAWENAFCTGNNGQVKNAQQQAASFNTAGDSGTFTPGTSADSKLARYIADYQFWDVLP